MSEALRRYYLQTMGIDIWLQRQSDASSRSLAILAKDVAACTQCSLHKTRTQTVFSRGNPQAKLMIIGEAPGFYEDKQGLPFVGKAGELLNQMMQSIELDEQHFYIANVLKCRPPDNRDPTPEEMTHCSAWLAEQITLVQPTLILALGRFAGQYLLNKPATLREMRNQIHHYHNIPVMVSYHPAYLLRNPKDKKKSWMDLQAVSAFIHGQIPSATP